MVTDSVSEIGFKPVYQSSIVSTGNSTTTPLASGATFTGVGELNSFPEMLVTCITDVNSTLYVEFSSNDGTNYDTSIPFNVTAGLNEFHTLVKGSRTTRVRLVNGTGVQTYLRLVVEYGYFRQGNSALSTILSEDADAILTKSIGEETLIAEGKYQGRFIVNKYGQNTVIDTGTVPEDIWEGGGVYTGFPTGTAETVSVLSTSALDTATGTGAQSIRISGLDANYAIQTASFALTGTTAVTTTTTWSRINRSVILTAGSANTNVGTVSAYWSTTTTAVFSAMATGAGQSRIACYTIPAGYTGYLIDYGVSMSDNTANSAQMAIWVRENGAAQRVTRNFKVSTAYFYSNTVYGGIPYPEKTDIAFRCTAVQNSNANISAEFDLKVVAN